MENKKYPVIIQTWLTNIGSILISGNFKETDVLKWAKEKVCSWNNIQINKEEPQWQKAEYGNYCLWGIVQYGGEEDFGRSFNEIKAVLFDKSELPVDVDKLKQSLFQFYFNKNSKPRDLMVSIPKKEIIKVNILNKSENKQNLLISKSQNGKKNYFTLTILFLIFISILVFMVQKEPILQLIIDYKKILNTKPDGNKKKAFKKIHEQFKQNDKKQKTGKQKTIILPEKNIKKHKKLKKSNHVLLTFEFRHKAIIPAIIINPGLSNSQYIQINERIFCKKLKKGEYKIKFFLSEHYSNCRASFLSDQYILEDIAYTIKLEKDTIITFDAQPKKYEISFKIQPLKKGIIYLNPGLKDSIMIDKNGKRYVTYNENIVLIAKPWNYKQWEFYKWSVDGKGFENFYATGQIKGIIKSDLEVIAFFRESKEFIAKQKRKIEKLEKDINSWLRTEKNINSKKELKNFITDGNNYRQQWLTCSNKYSNTFYKIDHTLNLAQKKLVLINILIDKFSKEIAIKNTYTMHKLIKKWKKMFSQYNINSLECIFTLTFVINPDDTLSKYAFINRIIKRAYSRDVEIIDMQRTNSIITIQFKTDFIKILDRIKKTATSLLAKEDIKIRWERNDLRHYTYNLYIYFNKFAAKLTLEDKSVSHFFKIIRLKFLVQNKIEEMVRKN